MKLIPVFNAILMNSAIAICIILVNIPALLTLLSEVDGDDAQSTDVTISCSHDKGIQCRPGSIDCSTQCNTVLKVDVATQRAKVLSHTVVQCY